MQDMGRQRETMVRRQIAARGITSESVLDAMRRVPRHLFVPLRLRSRAYDDCPQPIGDGQTISQPYIVALMTEMLGLRIGDRVLEIGTGSGYQAAVLADVGAEVCTLEYSAALAVAARRSLEAAGCRGIEVLAGDGWRGWPGAATESFDAALITFATPKLPPELVRQVRVGGCLCAPIGPAGGVQDLRLFTRRTPEDVVSCSVCAVRFVPVRGEGAK